MLTINDQILEWVEEGKTDAEISKLILEEEGTKDFQTEEIVELITKIKKEAEINSSLKKIADQKQKDADKKIADQKVMDQVNKIVEDKLKSINIDPFASKFKRPTDLKTFDPATGKIIEIKTDISEAYGAFNAMMFCFSEKDMRSAKAISREIDQDNAKYRKQLNEATKMKLEKLGIKAANDPIASDNDARGGYAVPTEVEMVINQLVYDKSVMLANMNTDNIIYEDKIYPLMYGISVSDIADQDTAVTESQPTFDNPTITMYRAGAYTNLSNVILKQKGADLTRAITTAYAAAFARFLDLRLAIGNVTTNSDLVDGIAFDPNTNAPTAIALSALTTEQIATVLRTLSDEAGEIVMVANRKVVDTVGLLNNAAGNREYPQYLNGGAISPLGVPLKKNPKITSVLDIGGDARTGGTDDVLLAFSKEHCVAGISGDTRIDFSEHWRFANDQTTIRGIKSYGAKVLSATGTGGIVAIAQELTN